MEAHQDRLTQKWHTVPMDIMKMLSDLRTERSQLEEAILALERLSTGQGKRRGRPPKWLSLVRDERVSRAKAPKKRMVSSKTRKQMAAPQHAALNAAS
jgi:hypothetical protein